MLEAGHRLFGVVIVMRITHIVAIAMFLLRCVFSLTTATPRKWPQVLSSYFRQK